MECKNVWMGTKKVDAVPSNCACDKSLYRVWPFHINLLFIFHNVANILYQRYLIWLLKLSWYAGRPQSVILQPNDALIHFTILLKPDTVASVRYLFISQMVSGRILCRNHVRDVFWEVYSHICVIWCSVYFEAFPSVMEPQISHSVA